MSDLLPRAAWPRVIPFVLFMALLALRGNLPEDGSLIDPRWVYGIDDACVHPDHAAPGAVLDLDVRGSRIPATVVALPFYRREA